MTNASAHAGFAVTELQALNRSFATVALDPQGRILRVNNRFVAMFGWEPEEVVGRDVSMFLPPDEAARAVRLRPRVRGGESRVTVDRRLRRDGTEAWVRSHVTPVLAPDGTLVETIAILSEVTEEMLRAAGERGQVAAINRSQSVVHFAPDGTVLCANTRFLEAMGYRRDEVEGRHHRMFVDPAEARGEAYGEFWRSLRDGRFQAGDFRRIASDGRDVWFQATYNPILDPSGRLTRIVEYASDVTAQKLRQAEHQWQIAAIDKSHAVVTFDMAGALLDANAAFLDAFGYRLEDIRGRHHRMFVEPSHAHSADYAAFWRQLRAGRHHAGLYRRVDREGRPVWLQATYNPIFDMAGRATRVVKYATVVTDERLRQAENEGQIAAIHKSQCVISFALDGTILDANDNFLETVGYRYAEVLGRHHRMFVPAEEAGGEDYRAFWQALAAGHHRAGEFRRVGRDGREIWLQATYSPILDMDGRPFKVVKYATDVTAQKLLQADHQGQIEAVGRSQAMMTLGLDGTIVEANANMLGALGYAIDEIRGRHHSMLVEPEVAAGADYAALWESLRAGVFRSGLFRRVGKGGRTVWLQATYSPILDPRGRPFKVVKFATDVTENVAIAEAYEDAKRQAQHDPATALPNRARLAGFMGAALSHPESRLAVLYIDLDRFKPINDTYGHPAGDTVLGAVADRMRRLLRDDQLVARVGGDEFVIAAPNLSETEVEELCQRLLPALAAPIRHGEAELQVSASIGVAMAPGDAATPDELLRCADAALYRSKAAGRATFAFHCAEQDARLAAHRQLVDEMRRGLAKSEFVIEYQPRFQTGSHAVLSVEALVRWDHPERGRMLPADFIPHAERSGLILPLGEWVLRTACGTIASMGGVGVSVNVSPVQFRDARFVETVAAILAETGLASAALELEITEGAIIEDADRARSIIAGIKALGPSLALDDFGTGYSSMSYLCDFPFDVIKIDGRFVAEIEKEGGRAVVQAILGLGRSLGLAVVAEGVETAGQLALLMREQCREVQGFLLAHPLPAEELAAFLRGEAGAKPAAAGDGAVSSARAASA